MARHCPECGDPMSPRGVCGSCGHGKTTANGKPFDPDWWRCANEERGLRCANPGGISHGTRGEGSWYCQAHAFPSSTVLAAPSGTFKSMRTAIRSPDVESLLERAALQEAGHA